MYHPYNEKELISAIKNGDDRAFVEIYERYWDPLFKQAYYMTEHEDLAKDIVQESFVSLWDRLPDIDINNSLKSYLFIAVRHKVLNHMAHGKVQDKYLQSLASYWEESENHTDHSLRAKILQEQIDKQIFSLPSKMRLIFEMSRKEYLSHKEIADTLQISDKTVKKQISKALKILRVKLEFLFTMTLLLLF